MFSHLICRIERGVTDPSIGRIREIAKILEVNILQFFQEETISVSREQDLNNLYGFATKSDIQELMMIIKTMKQEIARLQASSEIKQVKKNKKI